MAESIDADTAYAALRARDARFDGRWFVGVRSTGVYCRPVCRVRTPLRRHCVFLASAAEAEAAGFRPCLRCRPELAPGLSLTDAGATLAAHAERWMDERLARGEPVSPARAAARLGVSARHLRRLFEQQRGVAPLAWLTTRRLLLAKQLLTDTRLPMTEVAVRSGFGSQRRFNAAFAAAYRLAPGALRRKAAPRADAPLTIRLGFRPPYDADSVFGHYALHAVDGVESVRDGLLRRSLSLRPSPREAPRHGWLEARLDLARHRLDVRIAPELAPALGLVVQRLRRAFDLDAEPEVVRATLRGLSLRPGLRVAGAFCGFETAARIVLGQQVGVGHANALTARFVTAFGARAATPWPAVAWSFPTAAAVAAAGAGAIAALGMPGARARALHALAVAVHEGRLDLDGGQDADAAVAVLRGLPGIGDWTLDTLRVRALRCTDVFPAGDVGLQRAAGERDVRVLAARAEAWRPWRSYAAAQLWRDSAPVLR